MRWEGFFIILYSFPQDTSLRGQEKKKANIGISKIRVFQSRENSTKETLSGRRQPASGEPCFQKTSDYWGLGQKPKGLWLGLVQLWCRAHCWVLPKVLKSQ